MKLISLLLSFNLVLFLSFISPVSSSEQKLPVIEGKEVVAMINYEPLTLEEFSKFLANIEHEEMGSKEKTKAIDYAGILNRLIDKKLFLLEARNIGFDKLPEVTESIDRNSRKIMAQMLVRQEVKNIQVDEEEVERQYKEAVKEFKVTGVIFENESNAKKVLEKLEAGNNFDDIMKQVTESGEAIEVLERKYLKKRELLSQVDEVLSEMEIGAISDVVKFDKGFLIIRLDDIRFPEKPEVRKKIKRSLWKMEKDKAVDAYIESLVEKYVTLDQKMLDSINYETSEGGFDELLKDKRIIARIKKDKPVTVGDLTAAFETKLYHGVEKREKQMNNRKKSMLNEILRQRVLIHEARKQKIDQSETYKDKIKKFENGIISGLFVDKVISSSIKLNEDELKAHYDEHRDSYTTPRMMKIDSLVFNVREHAEDAIATLRTGTEFKWLSANVAGQVRKDTPGLLDFGGNIFSVSSLPEAMQKVLSGVDSEDFRIYESEEGFFYVLNIQKVFPSTPRKYQEVRSDIIKELYNIKMKEAVKHWSAKLKEHYPVEIYLTEF